MYGVELIESAVEDARRNASRNGLTNCVFVAGKAEDEVNNLIDNIKKMDMNEGVEGGKIVAILDPPRAGLRICFTITYLRGCLLNQFFSFF